MLPVQDADHADSESHLAASPSRVLARRFFPCALRLENAMKHQRPTNGPDASNAPDAPTPSRAQAVARDAGLDLRREANGLVLSGDGLTLCLDFADQIARLKPGNLHRELIVRAAKLRGSNGTPTAIDCTAGLGTDALLLAAAGFSVRLFERNPTVASLLRDALHRASKIPELAEAVGRMSLFEEDSIKALAQLPDPPDVIYLDPMFPARRTHAAVKKAFQLLHRLEGPCEGQEALLEAALAARPRKVIVKRPPKAPFLAGVKPSYSLSGKIVRYDCIVTR